VSDCCLSTWWPSFSGVPSDCERLLHRGQSLIVKIGRLTRCDTDDLDDYIESNRAGSARNEPEIVTARNHRDLT
jgi:hypothetical protein